MLDLCRIIFGIVVDLFRPRAALEAEIGVNQTSNGVLQCPLLALTDMSRALSNVRFRG
jgi:hypothetical protein